MELFPRVPDTPPSAETGIRDLPQVRKHLVI
jgi:hypothetical protein